MADKVTVTNELRGEELSGRLGDAVTQRRRPFETRLLPLDQDDDPITLPSSPAGDETTSEPEWEVRDAVGTNQHPGGVDWVNSPPDSLTMEVTLQAKSSVVGDFTPWDLQRMLDKLTEWANEPSPKTGEPTRVVVERGSNRASDFGIITSLSKNVLETDPEGLPRTVELSIELMVGS